MKGFRRGFRTAFHAVKGFRKDFKYGKKGLGNV